MAKKRISTTLSKDLWKICMLSDIKFSEALELGIKILTKIPTKTAEIEQKIKENKAIIRQKGEENEVFSQKLAEFREKQQKEEEKEEENTITLIPHPDNLRRTKK